MQYKQVVLFCNQTKVISICFSKLKFRMDNQNNISYHKKLRISIFFTNESLVYYFINYQY